MFWAENSSVPCAAVSWRRTWAPICSWKARCSWFAVTADGNMHPISSVCWISAQAWFTVLIRICVQNDTLKAWGTYPAHPLAASRLRVALRRRPSASRRQRRALGLTRLRVWPKLGGAGESFPRSFVLERSIFNAIAHGACATTRHENRLTRESIF